ncbi:hypothetical protein BES34_021355 [Leptospira inadai serovar Lyme]|nr:hypothetical protein BES34_021355 [Leptospira inadai serovar Lyme]
MFKVVCISSMIHFKIVESVWLERYDSAYIKFLIRAGIIQADSLRFGYHECGSKPFPIQSRR